MSPKFSKKKRCVARESLLEQGEKIINELASNRAMLEIHYEDEVWGYGTMKPLKKGNFLFRGGIIGERSEPT